MRLSPHRWGAYWKRRFLPWVHRYLGLLFPPLAKERFRADLFEPYDEWSVIYDPVYDRSTASVDLIRLACEAAEMALSVDLTALADRAPNLATKREITTWPGHHYRYLTALARVRGARRIVEVGTATGGSALAFMESPSVESLLTFDLIEWSDIGDTLLRKSDFDEKLVQRLADLSVPGSFELYADDLAAADIVFLDGPKDGLFEPVVLDKLLRLQRQREQLLILDDVRVITMLDLWHQLALPKLDAASLSHWSGTGLVLLSPHVG